MNVSIGRLFWALVLLFVALIAFTSRWTVFEAKALRENANNRRPLLQEQLVRRGTILASNGAVLAKSVSVGKGRFQRKYPTNGLFVAPVGYAFTDLGSAGLERSMNDFLIGRKDEVVSVFDSLLGHADGGRDIKTTLNPKGQEAAASALAGRKGAVVALDIKTGAVLTMYSDPSYNPNGLDRAGRFSKLANDQSGAPRVNRTTQGRYPPGSTFKVVTATAALESGKFTPNSVLNGDSGKVISTVPLGNFNDKSWGDISLTSALTNSVNTVWAQVGVDIGAGQMEKYMKRFGFYEKPELDYPSDQLVASGLRRRDNGKLLPANSGVVDVGRLAIGQERLEVTPLQMAMVAATIGNDGVRMRPFLTEQVIDPDGRTVKRVKPKKSERVMESKTAAILTKMMKNVVNEGSGTAAALSGIEVAGKTGTAEIDRQQGINEAWFIGFSPQVAVAVIVERVHGQGGTIAAPIARNVLQALGATNTANSNNTSLSGNTR